MIRHISQHQAARRQIRENGGERERCNQPIIYTANQTNAYNRIGHEILYRIVYNPRDLNSHLICSIQIFTWHITHTHPCMCVVCTQVIICNESLYPLMFVYNKRSRSIQEAQKWTVPATFEMKQSSFASSLLDENEWNQRSKWMRVWFGWLLAYLSFPNFCMNFELSPKSVTTWRNLRSTLKTSWDE